MRHLENTGLFILSGFFFLFFRKLDYFFVCAFLLCLCLCCTSYFAQSKRLHLVLCTAFIAAAFLIPGMFLFFPQYFMCSFWISIIFRLFHAVFFTFTASGQTENEFLFFPSGESSCFSWLSVCKTAQKPQNVWNNGS